jgi:carbon storage regulator
MLVLSRKESQRIRLGDSIVVTIVKIGGDKVRIGIEAPDDVLVLRDELEAWDTSAPSPSDGPGASAKTQVAAA